MPHLHPPGAGLLIVTVHPGTNLARRPLRIHVLRETPKSQHRCLRPSVLVMHCVDMV